MTVSNQEKILFGLVGGYAFLAVYKALLYAKLSKDVNNYGYFSFSYFFKFCLK